MPASRTLRYALFGLLYFTQGTILSYFTALNALYFLSQGLTMTSVGIFSSIALIPFVVKIFLGMLSDRINLFGMGYRKPYILIGLAIQTVCLVIAPFIDLKTQYWGFVALAFTLQMGMALYDTCTDGLALDTTPTHEQGTIQGVMVAGRAVGVIAIASVVGLLAEKASWLWVFWLLAALTLLPLPLVLRLSEQAVARQRFTWSAFRAFKSGSIWLVAAIGLISFMVMVGANQLVNPSIQVALGTSLSTAGLLTTVWGIGVVIGGLLGGRLNDRLGRRNAILGALLVTSLAVALLAAFIKPGALLWFAFTLVAFFGLAYGTYQATIFALAMHYTEVSIAASMFAILMAFTNIGQAVGLGFGGGLVDSIGYSGTFFAFAAVNLVVIPLLFILARQKQPERGKA